VETLSCGSKKKMLASSRFTMAAVALPNSPAWNRHHWAKGENCRNSSEKGSRRAKDATQFRKVA
jgi:hypothetical protein